MDIFAARAIAPSSRPVLMLAPMEGITNPIFRQLIVAIGGVDTVATEFVRITSGRQTIQPFVRHEVPLQIQFMGTDAIALQQCIMHLKAQGLLHDHDWIDFNVGCPSRRVNSSGAGAALLKERDKLRSIIGALREAHPGPLSVKTRLGFDDASEFHEILKTYTQCPIDFITVHARTRCGGYHAPVDHTGLRQAVEALPFPVIGNGDIFSVEAGHRMIAETGVRGIMIGRGAIQNPFIFRELAAAFGESPFGGGQSAEASHTELRHFCISLLQHYCDHDHRHHASGRNVAGPFKEFATWFSKNPLVGATFFSRIKRLGSPDELHQAVLSHFNSCL